jgi:hypothetical protein
MPPSDPIVVMIPHAGFLRIISNLDTVHMKWNVSLMKSPQFLALDLQLQVILSCGLFWDKITICL